MPQQIDRYTDWINTPRVTPAVARPWLCVFLREKFMADNRYLYRQVAYDYEPIFATGTMLGVTDTFAVLGIMDAVEKMGLDVMSCAANRVAFLGVCF